MMSATILGRGMIHCYIPSRRIVAGKTLIATGVCRGADDLIVPVVSLVEAM